MNTCSECGRLCARDETGNLCDVCFEQYDRDFGLIENVLTIQGNISPEDIAVQVHISVERVKSILERHELEVESTASDKACAKCNTRPALPNAQYCLSCQLTMFKSLGDEAHASAHNNVKAYEAPDSSIASLRETMDRKRSRGGFNRMTPNRSVKGNRKR
ncbi:hypothetical protein JYT90_00735 [bacterium AH-315-P07]|nr:hypothetical protein [bacterium AH-315-P07]